MSGKPNKKNEVGSLMKTASRRLGGGKSTPLDFVYSKTANARHNSAKILPNLTRKTKKSNKMCHVHGRKKDCLTVTPVVYSKTANAIHKKVDVYSESPNTVHKKTIVSNKPINNVHDKSRMPNA